MTRLSRRQFLGLLGISAAGVALHPVSNLITAADPFPALPTTPMLGRPFAPVRVMSAPNTANSIMRVLWPDTVVPIEDEIDGWLRIGGRMPGYVPVTSIQPVVSTPARPLEATSLPFPVWVVAPVASIGAWCAADAPTVTHIGHGGTAWVVERLIVNGEPWYALAHDAVTTNAMGWSRAAGWHPYAPVTSPQPGLEIDLHRAERRLDVHTAGGFVFSTPITCGGMLNAGRYSLQRGAYASTCDDAETRCGVPFALHFGHHMLHGAYWHNDFGSRIARAGNDIHIAPHAARWLYEAVQPVDEYVPDEIHIHIL